MAVTITKPASGSTLKGTTTVDATFVGQNFDIATLTVDGKQLASDSAQPISFAVDTTKVADGAHTLVVAVRYRKGGRLRWDKASIPISVNNVVQPPSQPTLQTNVNEGQSITKPFTWTAIVTPIPDKVEFWADGGILATDAAAPFSTALALADGAHQLGICAWHGSVRTCFGQDGIVANVTVGSGGVPPVPPTGQVINAPADLASIQASAQPGTVFTLRGAFGDQTFTGNTPVTFIADAGATLGDVTAAITAGGITFKNLKFNQAWLGMVGRASRRCNDIRFDGCDFTTFMVWAAERITFIGCDIGPAHTGIGDSPFLKPMIATNPDDTLAGSPYDILIQDSSIHDITMDSGASHVEGCLVYAGNGITFRNVTFARNQGTADISVSLLGWANAPSPGSVPDLQNVLIENCHGTTTPHTQDMDIYYNVMISDAVRGVNWSKLHNNNVWPLGVNGPASGPPATIAPPPGWPR
jgi:Bacterial Ig domain